jgi:predicted dinucleotide-binding enzyme
MRYRSPWRGLRFNDALEQAGDLSGKVVLRCALPMNPHRIELILGRTSSVAEELAKNVPGQVVSVFNTYARQDSCPHA